MFNSDLESEFQNFRSTIPQRKVLVEIHSQRSRLDDSIGQLSRQVEWIVYDAGPRHITSPLIFLPPAYAPAGAVFFRQIVTLSNLGYRCIALDYPVIWSVNDLLRALLQLLDVFRLDRVHIFGVEFGGYLAQRFAYFTRSLAIPIVGFPASEQTENFVALGSVDSVPLATDRRPRVRSLILCSSFAFPPLATPVYPLAAIEHTAGNSNGAATALPKAPPPAPVSSSDSQRDLPAGAPRNTIAQRYSLSGASSLYWLLPGAVLRRVLTGPQSAAVAAWRSNALEWAHSHTSPNTRASSASAEPDSLLLNAYQLLTNQVILASVSLQLQLQLQLQLHCRFGTSKRAFSKYSTVRYLRMLRAVFNVHFDVNAKAWKLSQAQLASRLTLVSERPPPLALKPVPRLKRSASNTSAQPLSAAAAAAAADSVSPSPAETEPNVSVSSASNSTQTQTQTQMQSRSCISPANEQPVSSSDVTIIEVQFCKFAQIRKQRSLVCTPIDAYCAQTFDSDAEQCAQRESLSLRYPGARLAFLKSGGLALYLTEADQVTLFVQVHLKQYDSTLHRARRQSTPPRRASSPEHRRVKSSSGARSSQASAFGTLP